MSEHFVISSLRLEADSKCSDVYIEMHASPPLLVMLSANGSLRRNLPRIFIELDCALRCT